MMTFLLSGAILFVAAGEPLLLLALPIVADRGWAGLRGWLR